MNSTDNKPEKFDFQFLGLKVNTTNPGAKTLILLVCILFFFIILFMLWKPAGLSALLISQGKNIQKGTVTTTNWLKHLWKGKAP
jgi:hypothetical protein